MTSPNPDRRMARQRERRGRKQADIALAATVRAVGGDPDDFMDMDCLDECKGRSGRKSEGCEE